MTKDQLASASLLDPLDCISYRLRRAARITAKSYDEALRPSGLRNTQFTLLATLKRLGESNIGDLSEALAIDGTTMTRNLEVLYRRNLVENIAADDERVRKVGLTAQGATTLRNALPLWRKAQRQAIDALSPDRWTEVKAELDEIEATCRSEK